MPPRSHLLSAAVLASALASGGVWFWHAKSGGGTVESANQSGLNEAAAAGQPGTSGKTGGTRSGTGSGQYGRDYSHTAANGGETGMATSPDSLHGRALPGTTPGGRGLFAPPASRKEPAGENPSFAQSGESVSEAELQWRAAQVEQEANHDLKRLVKLLDLDEQQQDRIFQTLASRSADWHPLMRTTTISPDFPFSSGADNGNTIANTLPPASGGGNNGESPAANTGEPPSSSGKTGNSPSTTEHSTSADSGNVATNGPPTQPPLVDVLAPELTPEQQAQLAEEEMDREEWWESIIPRLLPDEDELESDTDTGSDGVYAVPPDATSDTTGTGGTVGANSVSPTTPGAQ